MKTLLSIRLVALAFQITIGIMFVYSGFLKIQDLNNFADSIASFQMFPEVLINFISIGLPPFEILLGLCFLTGWRVETAAFSVMILSLIFAFAFAQALTRGLEVHCGCFGEISHSMGKAWLSLFRDIGIGGIATFIYLRNATLRVGNQPSSTDHLAEGDEPRG